jgi:hypothetical protein
MTITLSSDVLKTKEPVSFPHEGARSAEEAVTARLRLTVSDGVLRVCRMPQVLDSSETMPGAFLRDGLRRLEAR